MIQVGSYEYNAAEADGYCCHGHPIRPLTAPDSCWACREDAAQREAEKDADA